MEDTIMARNNGNVGTIRLASSIHRTGAQPLDDSLLVNSVSDLYAEYVETDGGFTGFNPKEVYEGMMVVVKEDHSIYVLTDVTKVGQAAGWKKIGDASGDITTLQQQINKLNGSETAEGSVKKIAKGYADAAGESAREYANGLIHVDGVASGDKILSLGDDKNLSADVSLSYDISSKKLFLYGKTKSPASAISTIDCASFVKDGMLDGSALYKATAATGKVTIKSKEYSLSGLTANHTYIVLVWNTDAAKDAMAIDVTTLIDTYTAGNGLKLSNNQFSIDTGVVATAAAVTTLGNKKIQGTAIKDITDAGLTLNGSNVKITAATLADKYELPEVGDNIDTVVGKFMMGIAEAKTAAEAAANSGVQSIAGKTGKFTLEGFSGINDPDNGVVLSVDDTTNGGHSMKARVVNVDGSKIKAGTISKDRLAATVRTSLANADSALQGVVGDDYILANTSANVSTIAANTATLDGESDGLVTAQDARQYVSNSANNAQELAEKYAESLMTWATWEA